jgi:cell wall-associated NlpC family hydrolase|tara:strand:- start:402 stop:1142 length:741 start_codon:yes stop_codon:yes gene_type:complete
MMQIYSNNFTKTNVYKTNSFNSEIISQMIYGECFSVIESRSSWLKVKIKTDGYTGFIKKKKYTKYIKPTHKVYSLKANVYKNPSFKKKIMHLTYGSRVRLEEIKLGFIKFEKGWVEIKNLKHINFRNKNIFSQILIFKNVRYKWGCKSFDGVDCSALVQLCFNFNNKFCPRDTKDQIKYFKKNVDISSVKKNDVLFWKGHVAVAISKDKLIHAYGPKKKTIVMKIKKTIDLIKRSANLKLISVKRI